MSVLGVHLLVSVLQSLSMAESLPECFLCSVYETKYIHEMPKHCIVPLNSSYSASSIIHQNHLPLAKTAVDT